MHRKKRPRGGVSSGSTPARANAHMSRSVVLQYFHISSALLSMRTIAAKLAARCSFLAVNHAHGRNHWAHLKIRKIWAYLDLLLETVQGP